MLEPTKLGLFKSKQRSFSWTGENLIICYQCQTDAHKTQSLLIYVPILTIYFERSNNLITQIKKWNIPTCVPSALEHDPVSISTNVVAVKSAVKTLHQLPMEKLYWRCYFKSYMLHWASFHEINKPQIQQTKTFTAILQKQQHSLFFRKASWYFWAPVSR